MARYTLLDAVDEDTDGSGVEFGTRQIGVWVIGDDFGSGTVTIQVSPDSGTHWITPAESTFTANGYGIFEFDGSFQMRATLSGSTSPSNVSVFADEGSY